MVKYYGLKQNPTKTSDKQYNSVMSYYKFNILKHTYVYSSAVG